MLGCYKINIVHAFNNFKGKSLIKISKMEQQSLLSAALRQRHVRLPVDCAVCGRPSMYNYYNARCCESCKQFFRRVVVKELEFVCNRDAQCRLMRGDRCNSCRLDKCLLAGMDPQLVNMTANGEAERMAFLLKLYERKNQALGRCSPSSSESSSTVDQTAISLQQHPELEFERLDMKSFVVDGDFQLVDSLLFLEAKQRRIWDMFTAAPTDYLGRFNTLEDMLRYPGNILAKSDRFLTRIPPRWNKEAYMQRVETFGIVVSETFDFIYVDRLLLVEMAKAMPFFRRLEVSDQKLLLRHVASPVAIFCNSFYSASAGSDTWIRCNGLTFISAYQSKKVRAIDKIDFLSWKNLCFSVEKVKEVGLCRDEFVLLLAILYCRSTAPNISELASDLLYTESVRYSRVLLKILQQKYGDAPGAGKYGQLMQLMESMMALKYVMQCLITRLEMADHLAGSRDPDLKTFEIFSSLQ